ncbi:MAG: Gfo/Idh/MocA family oxidoreductase [Clostridia bacterium]|nr:Gfo/Idh/MocA family oxidoreductase [Clostridia bacterium]
MDTSKRWGVMLIGCGHIGQQHIEDIYYRDNIRIVACVDYNLETAKKFAHRYGGEWDAEYDTDYHRFLDREDLDIVIIATYAETHLPIMRDCVNAGKHVLCEKPIAPTIAEAEEFCRIARASSSKVLIAHILRHNATYAKAAEMIRSGQLGDIRLIRMVQNHHIMNKARYMRLLEDCSPIVDCGVHYVDVIRWFTGLEVVDISGMGGIVSRVVPEDTYDYGMIIMKLSNGCTAYYEAGWTDTTASENLKEFVGTDGRIKIILADYRTNNKEEGDLIEYYDKRTETYTSINVKCKYKDMYGQLCALIDMIENDTDGFPTLEDAMTAFRIVMRCDELIRGTLNIDQKTEEVALQYVSDLM